MLVLKRKTGERIRIELDPRLNPATPVGELFRDRAIEIVVSQANAMYVKLGIDADPRLLILRDELQQKIG
ncbi:MAG: carbon storage regulator [Gammaproteobacteria bacterium]